MRSSAIWRRHEHQIQDLRRPPPRACAGGGPRCGAERARTGQASRGAARSRDRDGGPRAGHQRTRPRAADTADRAKGTRRAKQGRIRRSDRRCRTCADPRPGRSAHRARWRCQRRCAPYRRRRT